MDIYDWKLINRHVSLHQTNKKIFGKYYAKLKYYCPGMRVIDLKNLKDPTDFDFKRLFWHKERFRQRSYGNTYYGWSWIRPTDIDVWQLFTMAKLMQNNTEFKFRIEEPHVTIYSVDESSLYGLAKSDLHDYSSRLKEITYANQRRRELIDSAENVIVLSKPIEYNYKVVLKAGNYANKHAVARYLYNLGDLVYISDTVRSTLNKPYNYVYQVWFYAKEIDIIDFLKLIEPNIIANILEIKYDQ